MSRELRVALVSPGHPEFSMGGAQNASYSLFQTLKGRAGIGPIYLARCLPNHLGHPGAFGLFRGRPDEILWSPPPTDGFRLVTKSPAQLRRQVAEFCARIAPDVIHLHHYMGFGTDLIRMFKKKLGVPVILTLHEYLAICRRDGQMLKTNNQLCYASSPSECSLCFQDRSSGEFFLRKTLIMDNFSYVDLFVASSTFLAQRYIEWGIDEDRIRVIDNPLAVPCVARHQPEFDNRFHAQATKRRLAYFGQFTPYKGLDVLVEAVASLEQELREQVQVFLFGFQPDRSGTELQRRIAARIEALKGCIVPQGPYRNEDVIHLMRGVDWVVVPSIWWENSPLVIREARMAGVPVLCSNIGGMREKVRPGVDGAHFMVGNSADLADKIRAICTGELVIDVPPPTDQDLTIEAIIEAYRTVHARRRREYTGAEPPRTMRK